MEEALFAMIGKRRRLLSAACNDLATLAVLRRRVSLRKGRTAERASEKAEGNQEVIKALERAGKSYRFLTVSLSPFPPSACVKVLRALFTRRHRRPRLLGSPPSPPPNPKTPLLPNEIDSWIDRV